MKKLAHKIIIYDDVCPMCKAYTEGFVHLGWLPSENRIGFSEVPKTILDQIDSDRARHEIPLFDTETGETLYGKDALFYILGEQMPVLKPLFGFAPFRAIIFGFYQIITYNRRIIAGSPTPKTGFDCAPDFHPFYRWLYISLATVVGVLLLHNIKTCWWQEPKKPFFYQQMTAIHGQPPAASPLALPARILHWITAVPLPAISRCASCRNL